jgi:hypothetical protein
MATIDPDEEKRRLDELAKKIEAEAEAAFEKARARILKGDDPRDAIDAAMGSFTGQYAGELATAFRDITGRSIGTASVMAIKAGPTSLSENLYAQSREVTKVVGGIVQRHAEGFQDARRLSLEIFEGYGFRSDEPLKINPRNPLLPQYMRTELLTDPSLQGELSRYFAKLQTESLKTPALRAAYLEALDAIEAGKGEEALNKKLRVAMDEKVRYYANRIAQTELHRAYAHQQAHELASDTDVEWVQWRLSPSHPRPDICDVFAGVDGWGMGAGVYPVRDAPVAPAHPFCRCYLVPRTDIKLGRRGKFRPDAAQKWVDGFSRDEGARIMGSRARFDAVVSGSDPWDVYNATKKPDYIVPRLGDVVGGSGTGFGPPPVPVPRRPWDSSTKAGKWHDASFAEGDPRVGGLIQRVGDPGDVKLTPGTGAYARHSAYIEMDSEKIGALRGQSVWRHEYGHHIDGQVSGRAFAYRSSAADFDTAIKADSKSMVRDSAAGNLYTAANKKRYSEIVNQQAQAISSVKAIELESARAEYLRGRFARVGIDFEDFKATMERHADFPVALKGLELDTRYSRIAASLEMKDAQTFLNLTLGERGTTEAIVSGKKGSLGEFSDLIGSVSLNKVGGLNQSGWGHSDSYYKKASFMRGTETFADLTALHGDANHKVWDKVLDRFVPQTNAIFKGILDGNP